MARKATTQLPTHAEYEAREAREARIFEERVDSAPLSERKEAQREFLDLMQHDPAALAERAGWLIDGNYGYGPMMLAKRLLASPRSNQTAGLTLLVSVFEKQCPRDMAIAAWKKLTPAQKRMLDDALNVVIHAAAEETE